MDDITIKEIAEKFCIHQETVYGECESCPFEKECHLDHNGFEHFLKNIVKEMQDESKS